MIPSRQSWHAETTSSCYSPFLAHSHSLISFSSLWLLSHTHFVSYTTIDAHTATVNSFESHCSTPVCLSSIPSYQAPPEILWFLCFLPRLHQTESIIKVKIELELWTLDFFFPKEIFHRESNCIRWQMLKHRRTQAPSSMQIQCGNYSTRFHVYILSTQMWSNWGCCYPWPKLQNEIFGMPFSILGCSRGKMIIAPLGRPVRSLEGPDRLVECSTEANKAEYFLSITSKSWGKIIGVRSGDRKTEISLMIREIWGPACASSILQMAKFLLQWQTWRDAFHCHLAESPITGLLWFKHCLLNSSVAIKQTKQQHSQCVLCLFYSKWWERFLESVFFWQ